MPAEVKREIQLEIAHVLFTDIVGYSKLPINEQRALVERLNEVVRGTDEFQAAEGAGRLIKIPTGDGITLVFYHSPEAPVECALEISRALKKHPELQLRMGIHSGPVSGVIDVTGKANVAGAGINMAQRVMDCGDAGHILLSKHVAEDLEQYPHWQPYVHELGECEVKHGVRVSLTNLYTEELGNPALPEKLKAARAAESAAAAHRKRAVLRWSLLGIAALLIAIAAMVFLSFRYGSRFALTPLVVPEKSIAVLPFENLSEEKQNAFFADGVQDEILTNLAKIADLKVISRASVMQYKSGITRNIRKIAQELGVANVLEGSVQRAGNRVRVSAQLVDARNDIHLWAEHYDRPLDDVFAIQSEIARAIADQLRAKLSPSEKAAIKRSPTADLAAFDLYIRAKTLLLRSLYSGAQSKNNLLQAVELLDQAVARDPNFLLAYCRLGFAHDVLYLSSLDHTPARLASAEAAVQTALRLQPDAGEAHLALAQHLYSSYLDYDHAKQELAIAQRTLPNSSELFELNGFIDRRQGRWDESTRNLEKVLELDPLNFFTLSQISTNHMFLRRYEQWAAVLDRTLAVAPKDVATRITRAAVDLNSRADPEPLHTTIDAILAEDPSAAPTVANSWLNLALCEHDPIAANRALVALSGDSYRLFHIILSPAFVEGLIARIRGDDAAARAAFTAARAQQEEVVRAQPDYAPALGALGLIDAGLGRKDDALREGRRAVQLLPVEHDAFGGSDMIQFFSVICAWTGEKELALQQLDILARMPSAVTYGRLKLHPFWDPLRGDPRFGKLLEESKQPVVLK
jgi:TolB-like protein/class 3 adenylate cyclase/Tfp pilus assembly protein PilF